MRCRVLFLCLAVMLTMMRPLSAQLVNPNASYEARELKSYLDSVYGKKIISGQMDDAYLAYIQQNTGGKAPAIMGYDFNGICPTQGGNNDAEKAIRWVKTEGGIAQFQWHWISPNGDGDFYTKNFNLATALANPSGSSYKNILRDIDLAAKEMKKLQDAGVAILWRPLHEAEGKWFWWGMAGGEACKTLYRLMYDRLVHQHNLNNLIWVWTSYGTSKENWYPGDDVVDLIVYDYPDYSTFGSWQQFQQLFAAKGKLFGIGEDGKLFDPNLFAAQPWLYFMTWAYMIQEPSQNNGKNPRDWLYKVYNDPRVITLADLQQGARANAGLSRTVPDDDGDGYAVVKLDGSASTAQTGAIVSFVWSENDSILAHGPTATVNLKSGVHTIILTITTSDNQSHSASVVITVLTVSLAYGKRVSVSSTEINFGNVAGNAVDGNAATRWSSAYGDPQWYQIDLGKKIRLRKVVLNWETGSARDYRLEVSDDAQSWTTVATRTDMAAGARIDTLDNLASRGRFVRLFGTARTSNYGYSLYEFEIYDERWGLGAAAFPEKNILLQNYPNPFNPTTTIEFYLTEPGQVLLDLYNVRGQRVKTLIDQPRPSGVQRVVFTDRTLASGVYFCRLTVTIDGKGVIQSTRKMTFLR